ncbi:PXA domain-containing protein [Chytridium lagenaria]|nr:PXA domain-containing protein [Chytridium lagenaria]
MLQDIKARAQALWEQGTERLPAHVVKLLPYLFLAIAISPRLFVLILLFGIGLIVGFAYGVPNASQAKTAGDWMQPERRDHIQEMIDHIQEMMGPKTQLAEFVPISPASDHPSHLAIPPEIDGELTKFLDFFIRDFINGWFDPLNHSKSSEFPSAVHAALRHSFITLGFAAARMNVVTAVVPISQSLVHHIREYRQYEQSSLDLPAYLARNPASKFNRHLDPKATQQHLRRLSAHIALSILPRSDKGSPVVFSFVRELLATTVLNSLVESISDPDVINRAIVERCGGSVHGSAESVASSTVAGFGDVRQPKMTRSRKSSENPYADQLYLKIVEGKRLLAGGTSFYCAIICGDDLLRTRKVMAEANPIWMEDFQFMWEKDAAQPVENIVIDLYDTRTFRDELVGTVTIPTANFQANKYTKAWHPLITSDARTGEVTPQLPNSCGSDDDIHKRPSNSRSPLSPLSPDFQPTDLTLLDVLQQNEALVEFMQYMEDLGASAYVQLYLMIETFRNSEIDGSVQDEAQMLFETFFTAGARFAISFDDVDPSLVARPERLLCGNVWKGAVKPDSIFKNYVRRETRRVSASNVMVGLAKSELEVLEKAGSYGNDGEVETDFTQNVTEVSPVKTEEVGSSSPQRGPPPKPPRASAPSSSAIMNVVVKAENASNGSVDIIQPVKQDEYTEEDIVGLEYRHTTAIRSTMSSTPPPPPLPSRPVAPSLPPRPSPTPPLNLMDADTDDISSMIMSSLEMENSGGSPVNASTKPPSLPYRPSDDAVEEAARRAAMEEEDRKLALQLQMMEEEDASSNRRKTRPRTVSNGSLDTTGSLSSLDRAHRGSTSSLGPSSTVEILAAEIVNVREQIVAVDEGLEKAMLEGGSSGRVKKLMDEKMKLMEQVSSLMDMVAEAEEAEMGGDQTVSLSDLRIKVTDFNGAQADPREVRKDTDRGLIFAVEVERKDGSAGWMLTHTFTDFQIAYDRLKDQFPKLSKSQFPALSPLQKSKVASQPETRAVVARELERWLLLILTDPAILGQMFGVLKSAGRVVKKAAVSTGNVVGSVGGAALNTGMSGINTIRRGITVDSAPKESSWEKKLEQRRASTSPQRQVIGAESMDRGRSAVPRVPPPPADSHHRASNLSPKRHKDVKSDDKKPPLSPQEIEAVLECLFGTIEEIFRLSDPNQWIRQKGLHMVKSVLRRTHGTYIAEMIQQRLEDAKSTPAVAGYLKSTTGALWPEGVFHSHAKAKAEASQNDSLSESQSNDVPPPKLPRTEEEKSDTRIEAKHLLLRCSGLLGLDALETVVGRYNTVVGITSIFNMLQHRELNRGLICAVLEAVIKSMLTSEH